MLQIGHGSDLTSSPGVSSVRSSAPIASGVSSDGMQPPDVLPGGSPFEGPETGRPPLAEFAQPQEQVGIIRPTLAGDEAIRPIRPRFQQPVSELPVELTFLHTLASPDLVGGPPTFVLTPPERLPA